MLQDDLMNGKTLYYKMMLMQENLLREIESLQRKINQYPEGELFCSKNSTYSKWHICKDGQMIYLPKTQRAFARKMANKKYLTSLLQDLQHDLAEINQYLSKHKDNPQKASALLSSDSAYSELLTQSVQADYLSAWTQKNYETNTFHPEGKIHTAPGTSGVRSKSEALIATFLFTNHIPFRYECALQIGGRTIYPDFTIRHPETGNFYYWEHFGKMDDPVYRKNAYDKIKFYVENNIHPGSQLVTTFETSDHPLSTHTIECRIFEFFTPGQLDKIS